MTDDYHRSDGGESAARSPLGVERAPVTPDIDTVFEVLADDQRREICLTLMGLETDIVEVPDLVDVLADGDTDRERLRIALHHRHLPKLADTGIIEYDARSSTARYWGQPTVEKWAEHIEHVDS
jgi:hypothetical protein